MSRRGIIPGFSWDSRRKVARFEVSKPGSWGKLRRRATVPAESRDAAIAAFQKFRAEAFDAPTPPPDRLTLSAYVERYLPAYLKRLAEATQKSYRWAIEKKILPALGGFELTELTMPAIRDFAGALKTDKLAASSINDILAILRLLIRDAYDRELLDRLPYRGRFPHEREEPLRLELSPSEFTAFVSAFDDREAFARYLAMHPRSGKVVACSRFRAERAFGGSLRPDGPAAEVYFERFRLSGVYFRVGLETGLRKSDLISLRFSAVDFERNRIRIVTRKKGIEALIPLSDACRDILLALKRRSVVSDFVFVDENGKRLSWSSLQRHFAIAKKIAGIARRFRPHDMRATYATDGLAAGVPAPVMQKAMGLTSPAMLARYGGPTASGFDQLKRAMDRRAEKRQPASATEAGFSNNR